MSAESGMETKGIHPHKFTLWVGIGSIVMMFAALTSAYIVRHAQHNWLEFSLPKVFWYSTFIILLSSLTMHLALKAFKARERVKYRRLLTVTALLGLAFAATQAYGFYDLYQRGIKLIYSGSNPSASFLVIITGLHVAHVLGGIVAILVILFRSYSRKVKSYNSIPLEIISTYWHFVDILWIYLFVFFYFAG